MMTLNRARTIHALGLMSGTAVEAACSGMEMEQYLGEGYAVASLRGHHFIVKDGAAVLVAA